MSVWVPDEFERRPRLERSTLVTDLERLAALRTADRSTAIEYERAKAVVLG